MRDSDNPLETDEQKIRACHDDISRAREDGCLALSNPGGCVPQEDFHHLVTGAERDIIEYGFGRDETDWSLNVEFEMPLETHDESLFANELSNAADLHLRGHDVWWEATDYTREVSTEFGPGEAAWVSVDLDIYSAEPRPNYSLNDNSESSSSS